MDQSEGMEMDLVKIRKKARKNVKEKKAGTKSGSKRDAEGTGKDQAAEKAETQRAAAKQKAAPEAPEAPEEISPAAEAAEEAAPEAPASGKKVEIRVEPEDLEEVGGLAEVLRSQQDEKVEEEEEAIQLLTFMLAGEEYGLNIMDIKEIVRPKDPTEVPKTPDYILGIISLRGMIIPIFDVKARLGLSATEQDQRSRIIVVKVMENFYGLLVDSVVQVMDIPLSLIEPPPEIIGGVEGEFLRGVGKMEDRLIILLNLARILTVDHEDARSSPEALVPGAEGKDA